MPKVRPEWAKGAKSGITPLAKGHKHSSSNEKSRKNQIKKFQFIPVN